VSDTARITPDGLADPFGVLEYAPEGFVLVDREFRVRYENEAGCRMLGLDRATVRGRSIWALVPALEHSAFGDFARRAMSEQRVLTITAPAATVPRSFSVKAYPTQDGLAIYFDDVTERETALRALRESEERLQLVVKAARVGIWDADLRTGEVFATDELRAIYGLAGHVVDLDTFRGVLDPADAPAVAAAVTDALARGAPWRARARIRRADTGAQRQVELHGSTQCDAAGVPVRSTGTARDITDDLARDDALLRTEGDLRRAQRMARIGTWHWDVRQNQVRWSSEIWTIFEFPLETTPSVEALNALYAPAELAAWQSAVGRTMTTGAPFEIELRTTLPSGRVLDVWSLGEVVRDDAGHPLEMFGTVQDITDARAQAQALSESERRFRTLSEFAPMGIVLGEPDGTAAYVNPYVQQLFEMSAAEFGRGGWLARVHPDDRERVSAGFSDLLRDYRPSFVEHRLVCSDGVRYIRATSQPIVGPGGERRGHVGIIEDITPTIEAELERRRTESREAETQKLESLGLLAGGIAHDFNNLLVGVLTNASLALLDLPDGHQARDAINDIERAAQRAADLTRQLLAYAGKGRYTMAPVDVSELVREMAQLLRSAIARKVSLRLELADGLPAALGDPTQFRQVVMNLITNASDSMVERGGALTVRTSLVHHAVPGEDELAFGADLDAEPRICVEVRDEGHGMTTDVLRRIFDPFFTTKFTGRGLGLSATIGILRQHGGTITVRSVPDAGTVFRLWFVPQAGPVPSAPPPAPAPELPVGGTILVVDDDEGVRSVARALLVRRGFTVVLAEDGREGLERFRAADDSLRAVLLDLTMPVLSGAEALAAMRAERPDVPVLLMSGYTEHELQQTFAGRATGFLQKPFKAQDLYAAIASILASAPPRIGA
jgi:two-component system, cell cycle sensor histidine kinase and response regulator CckA